MTDRLCTKNNISRPKEVLPTRPASYVAQGQKNTLCREKRYLPQLPDRRNACRYRCGATAVGSHRYCRPCNRRHNCCSSNRNFDTKLVRRTATSLPNWFVESHLCRVIEREDAYGTRYTCHTRRDTTCHTLLHSIDTVYHTRRRTRYNLL